MADKHWLEKFAENYSGSGDIDQHNVADGTEMPNSALQSPANNGGVYMDNEYQISSMPYPLGAPHESQNSQAEKDKPNPSRTDEYSEFPFGESQVDDNHANVVASINWPSQDDAVAGSGANFTHHAPDSPATMHDGHPPEELEEQQGVNNVFNNFVSKPTPQLDGMLMDDPSLINKYDQKFQNIPEINKGHTAMIKAVNPMTRSAREIRADAWVDDSGSNVKNIVNSDEANIKHDRSSHDFGTGDQSGDNRTMSDNPKGGYSGDDYEASNYAGVVQSASRGMADKALKNYLEKLGLKQKADYGNVTPSSNPNSGNDDDDLDYPYQPQPSQMTDGKTNSGNLEDKLDVDPNLIRQKLKYKKVEDDDKQNYYNTINTSNGFGNQGGGDFSGVVPNS